MRMQVLAFRWTEARLPYSEAVSMTECVMRPTAKKISENIFSLTLRI